MNVKQLHQSAVIHFIKQALSMHLSDNLVFCTLRFNQQQKSIEEAKQKTVICKLCVNKKILSLTFNRITYKIVVILPHRQKEDDSAKWTETVKTIATTIVIPTFIYIRHARTGIFASGMPFCVYKEI